IRATMPTAGEVLTSRPVGLLLGGACQDVLLPSNVMRSGVASLAKSLSRELASEGFCVNNPAPGTINTGRPWQVYL
ncbi:MAG: hypothetical protein OR999_07905, partial [Arenicellales bacterium]|nr:hypothetical protein [Arenicellales bacterium]